MQVRLVTLARRSSVALHRGCKEMKLAIPEQYSAVARRPSTSQQKRTSRTAQHRTASGSASAAASWAVSVVCLVRPLLWNCTAFALRCITSHRRAVPCRPVATMADAMLFTALLAVAVALVLGVLSFLLFALPNRPSRTFKAPAAAPPPSKKPGGSSSLPKHRSLAAEKAHPHRHHHLELNTLKGHGDAVTAIAFTSNGRGLATACADRVVRVFKLDDISGKSFKFLRINLPSGSSCPTKVAFGQGSSQLVIATEDISGTGLCMYTSAGGGAASAAKEQGKLAQPEIKWELKNVHDKKSIVSLVGSPASFGSGNGGVILASSSEGTDIKLWVAETGKCVGAVDTNQLKNTMATLSPNGRFLAAAAFTADVKIWEVVYGKDNQVKEVTKVMQLKGHKSAVTWLDFTWDSERVITASKDGSIRIWNINVRYHMDEDPKCIKVIKIPSLDSKGIPVHYDRLAVSPDNQFLAVTHSSTLQWLRSETGEVLDTAENAHDGDITSLVWAPQTLPTEHGKSAVLATASSDKKVKLWFPPSI